MSTVAYICADPGVPVFGTKGASVHVQEIIRALRRRGHLVRLYCTRLGDDIPPDLLDLAVVHHPVDRVDDRAADPRTRTAGRERRQRTAATALAQAVIADGADLVYERYSLFSTALDQVCRALAVPGVLEVNAPLVDEQREHRHLVDVAGAERALRDQCTTAAVITSVSEPVARWVRGRLDEEQDERVVIVPNGVDPDRIVAVEPAPGRIAEVVFVGTLKPWHGVAVLLEAATLARQPWRVRLVGDGPEGPRLREQATKAGLAVDFRGAVAPADVPAALAGASVAVAPYPAEVADGDQYFSPLKVYEYGAAALPVVASRVGQLPAVVQDGVTGLLVPPSDPVTLARAIDRLVADPQGARAMGAAARSLMIAEHSWDAVLDRALTGIQTPARRTA